MPVSAEPKPFVHALPGGRPDATVRVRPLCSAEMRVPPAFFARPGGPLVATRALLARRSRWTPVPIPAFLVDHPSAGTILVDTGLHAVVATDPADNLGPMGARLYPVDMSPEQAIPAQLEALGIDPLHVRAVVMTHLHLDHASGVVQFPEATFVVSAAEWAAAGAGDLRQGYRPRQFDHALDWRTIDYEGGGFDSFASFGRSADLLGDGSIRLVSTPGHTLGHQSLVLRLAGGELLLTGDAVLRHEALDNGELPLPVVDEHLYRRSLGELRRYLEQTPGAVVICGHDPAGWRELAEVYS